MYRGKVVDVRNLIVDTSKKVVATIYRKFINGLALALEVKSFCYPLRFASLHYATLVPLKEGQFF